jgi:hypothetical protein
MEGKEWPPLIVAKHQSAWIRGRDIALTLAMWLVLAFMMKPQVELLLASFIEHLGLGPLLERRAVVDRATDSNWREFFGQLAPYLAVALVLVALLLIFSFRTLMMRRRALRQSPPQPFFLATEARHAGLGAMRGYSGSATDALHGSQEGAALDNAMALGVRSLAVRSDRDQAALVDARSLPVSNVHIDADGGFHVESAKEPSQWTVKGEKPGRHKARPRNPHGPVDPSAEGRRKH